MPESRSRRAKQRGFSLLMTACSAVVMIGMLGLSFDVGRMFITKNELQTFADAAALAATAELTGAKSGVQGANEVALTGPLGATWPNAVGFETSRIPVANVTIAYGTSLTATFDSYATASGPNTNTYRFVRVTATANVPFYFLPVLPSVASQHALSATATAGQKPASGFCNGGLEPLSPAAHNPADTMHFGFFPGQRYTLKWGSPHDDTNCAGDLGPPAFNPGNDASQHDFVDIGQDTNANSSLREVIEFGGYPNPTSNPSVIVAGTVLDGVPGNRGADIFDALHNRSLQDLNQTPGTYEQYLAAGGGNGRRVVSVAIHDPAQNSGNGANTHVIVIGFGNFLIDPAADIHGSSGPICATYIGPASTSGASSGGSDGTKVYSVVLYQ